MLVNCNSCQKKFNVPDSAITESGRLLQCGTCGNKWTQYPIKPEVTKKVEIKIETPRIKPAKIKQITKVNKAKNLVRKKKREINLYSEEYLKKKHGLIIRDNTDNKINKKTSNNSNFFNYLIIFTIYLIALFAILNLTQELIVSNYPFTKTYINSLFEVIETLKVTISHITS